MIKNIRKGITVIGVLTLIICCIWLNDTFLEAKSNDTREICLYDDIRFLVMEDDFSTIKSTSGAFDNANYVNENTLFISDKELALADTNQRFVYEFFLADWIGVAGANSPEKVQNLFFLFGNDNIYYLGRDKLIYIRDVKVKEEGFDYNFSEDKTTLLCQIQFNDTNGGTYKGYMKAEEYQNGKCYVYLCGFSEKSNNGLREAKELVNSLDYNEEYEGNYADEIIYVDYENNFYNYIFTLSAPQGYEIGGYCKSEYNNMIIEISVVSTELNLQDEEMLICGNGRYMPLREFNECEPIISKSGIVFKKYQTPYQNDETYSYVGYDEENKLYIVFSLRGLSFISCDYEKVGDNIVKSFSPVGLDGEYITTSSSDVDLNFNQKFLFFPVYPMDFPIVASYFSREDNKDEYDRFIEWRDNGVWHDYSPIIPDIDMSAPSTEEISVIPPALEQETTIDNTTEALPNTEENNNNVSVPK